MSSQKKNTAVVPMPARWMNADSDALFEAILKLRNLNEARRFFRDLLTEKEIIEFSNRWKVAKMLSREKSYFEIEDATRMSSTTIARINQWLTSGMGGYRLVINRIGEHSSPQPRRGLS